MYSIIKLLESKADNVRSQPCNGHKTSFLTNHRKKISFKGSETYFRQLNPGSTIVFLSMHLCVRVIDLASFNDFLIDFVPTVCYLFCISFCSCSICILYLLSRNLYFPFFFEHFTLKYLSLHFLVYIFSFVQER